MGWCYEFGPQIGEHCDHPMVAGERSCTCSACGAVCTGRFGGCSEVWGRRQMTSVVELPHRPALLRFVERDTANGKSEAFDAAVVRSADPPDHAPDDNDRTGEEVLAWLKRAFAEIHTELRALGTQIHEHQAAVQSGRIPIADGSALADELMARVETALASADASTRARSGDTGPSVDGLRQSVDEVHELTDQLRVEMARLAAFRRALADTNPALGGLVDLGAARAQAHHEART